jgi:DTW domain-containing protein YfiP
VTFAIEFTVGPPVTGLSSRPSVGALSTSEVAGASLQATNAAAENSTIYEWNERMGDYRLTDKRKSG